MKPRWAWVSVWTGALLTAASFWTVVGYVSWRLLVRYW